MSTPPVTYWQLIRQRFLSNRRAKWAVRVVLFLMTIALLGDFIAGDIPIYCKYENRHYFPVFKKQVVDLGLSTWSKPFQNAIWREFDFQEVVYPLIPYASATVDKKNRFYKSPFESQEVSSWRFRHWLGTDERGHDLAAGIIEGLQSAFKVGLLSMLLASIIGVFFGGIAGYFGDDLFEQSIGALMMNILALLGSIHLGFTARSYALSEGFLGIELLKSLGITILLFFVLNNLVKWLERIPIFAKRVTIPVDLLVMRLIEVLNSIPGLLLIITLAATLKTNSIYALIFIIGMIGWTGIARFIRAELLKIRSIDYIQSAKAMGFSNAYILVKHALPNALGPALIVVAFGIAGAILAEATLSFLGIGVPDGEMTWGQLLATARQSSRSAWWLAVFPGVAIFTLVFLFNLIGEGLKEAIDSKE